MFLCNLEGDAEMRSFAFSSDLAEVTGFPAQQDRTPSPRRCETTAAAHRLRQAFVDFKKIVSTTSTTATIIILGDARNNYGDPRRHPQDVRPLQTADR
jgi:uncharacterized protein with von Willebrand factor type A (vWA) domain